MVNILKWFKIITILLSLHKHQSLKSIAKSNSSSLMNQIIMVYQKRFLKCHKNQDIQRQIHKLSQLKGQNKNLE